MHASILQFRGIDKAEFNLSGIILMAGPNGSGKTSICLAVAAALSGNPIPFLRIGSNGKVAAAITKGEAGRMVRSGYDTGGVRIKDGENEIAVIWPQVEVKSKGKPPVISIYAAGLMSILDLPQKEQIRALADLIKAIPTEAEITEAFKDLGMPEDRIPGTVERIRLNGWDSVHDAAKEYGAKLKGQWESFTKESYGSDKGAKWLPVAWEDGLENVADVTLTNALADARQTLETRLQSVAVADSVIAELESVVATIEQRQSRVSEAARLVETHFADEAKLAEALKGAVAALPPVEGGGPITEPLACPHCKKPVNIVQGQLVKVVKNAKKAEPTAEEVAALEALRDAVGDARSALTAHNTAKPLLTDALTTAQFALRTALEADTRLKGIKAAPPADTRPVDSFRDEIRVIEARIEARRQKEGADRCHAQVQINQRYIDLLASTGLRKRKLLRALDDFNAKMAELCTNAGYKLVSVDEEMTIRYAGRNYYLLSASEQYRVRAILQIAAAFSEGAPVVILDGADILDSAGRNGLFALLGKLDIIALVGMMMNKPEQAPNLQKFDLGMTYWVEGGTIKELE